MRILGDIIRFWPGRVLGPVLAFAALILTGMTVSLSDVWRVAPPPVQDLVLSTTAIPITSPVRLHDAPSIILAKGELVGPSSLAELVKGWISGAGAPALIVLRAPEIIIGGDDPAAEIFEGMPAGGASTVDITGATLRWPVAAGNELRLEHVEARINLHPDGTVRISNGTAHYAGREIAFSVEAAPDSGDAHEHAVRLSLASKGLSIGLQATLAANGKALDHGRLQVAIDDAGDVAGWLGLSFEGMSRSQVKAEGAFSAEPGLISLEQASVEIAGNRGQGSLRLQLAAGRPLIDATLAFARLDLGDVQRWLRTGLVGPADALAHKSRGSAAKLIGAVDADLRLSADTIRMGSLTTGHGAISATWRNDGLTVQLAGLDLYGGGASGQLDLRRQIGDSRAELALKLDNVDLRPLLLALGLEAPLDANSHVAVALTAAGRSWREARERLSGEVAVRAPDGALTRGGLERAVRAAMGRDVRTRLGSQAVDGLDWQIAIENGIMTRQSLAFDVNGVRYGAGVKAHEDEPAKRVSIQARTFGSR